MFARRAMFFGFAACAAACEDPAEPCVPRESDPSATVDERIRDACPAGVVELPAGTFLEDLTITRPITLRGEGSDQTILQGSGDGPVVRVSTTGGRVRLDGLTITGGAEGFCYGEDSGCWMQGGGLAASSPVVLSDVRVTGNSARDAGGGIVSFVELIAEADVVIDNNEAVLGSAVSSFGFLDLRGATIRENHPSDDRTDLSAPIHIWGGEAVLGPSTRIVGNSGGCGALAIGEGEVRVTGAEIRENVGAMATGACLYEWAWDPATLSSNGTDWGASPNTTAIYVNQLGTYSLVPDGSAKCGTRASEHPGCNLPETRPFRTLW